MRIVGESTTHSVGESGFAEFKTMLYQDGVATVEVIYKGKTYKSVVHFNSDRNNEFIFLSTDSSIYDAGDNAEISVFTGFDPNIVAYGLLVQFVFAFFVLKTSPGKIIFDFLNKCFTKITSFTTEGSNFVFGGLLDKFSFALSVLPTIIFYRGVET